MHSSVNDARDGDRVHAIEIPSIFQFPLDNAAMIIYCTQYRIYCHTIDLYGVVRQRCSLLQLNHNVLRIVQIYALGRTCKFGLVPITRSTAVAVRFLRRSVRLVII